MYKYSDYIIENYDISKIKLVSKYDAHLKKVTKYYNIPFAFDIETTSTYVNEKKFAFMYVWMFGINDGNNIFYGRTWDEFLDLCNRLHKHFQLSENKRIIVYIHNLGYEFQFMRKYFNWLSVFAVDDRKPVKAVCDLGIEFRDSYILSGYSLAKLADNLTQHKIKKLVGDLDYTLVRNSKTFLSDDELAYCNNDVEILLDYIDEQIKQYDNNITKIPLTNTGRVRTYVRNNCLHTSKSHNKDSKGKIMRYRELMKECSINLSQYALLKQAFQGGFTHASMNYTGMLLHNVHSIDFTSSYPAVMLTEKFPMSKPIFVDLRTESFKELLDSDKYGLLFRCTLHNVRCKYSYDSYISESKCEKIENPIVNNGRVFSADSLTTVITDVDFQIIKASYDFDYDNIGISICYKFYMEYLPKPILDSVLTLYEDKTTLKGVKGKETEYLLKKGMLNSVYGMSVTDIVRDEIEYSNNTWNINHNLTMDSMNEQIEKNNDSKQRFLYYPWGVWVTAYARKNLWTGILNIGDDYIYSDTDSIKFLNYEKHKNFINAYNHNIEIKLRKMCNFRKLDFNRCKPKTVTGKVKLIGVWDYEGMYTDFKTLGAKRYMYTQDGQIHITIAGLSKQNGVKYLTKQAEKNHVSVYDLFNNDMYIPASETGKNTHTYIDEEMDADITDYTGITEHVISKSAIHLEQCEFTLSISKQYAKFIQMLRNGYLFTGVKSV